MALHSEQRNEPPSDARAASANAGLRAFMISLWVHWSLVIIAARPTSYPLLLTSWLFLPFLCVASIRCLARRDLTAWVVSVAALGLSVVYAVLTAWFAPTSSSWTTGLLLWPLACVGPLAGLLRRETRRSFGALDVGVLGASFEAWEAFDTLTNVALASVLAPFAWAFITSGPFLFFMIMRYGMKPPECHSFVERFAAIWLWLNPASLAFGTPLQLLAPKRRDLPPARGLRLAGLVLVASLHVLMASRYDALRAERSEWRFGVDPNVLMVGVLASAACAALGLAMWVWRSSTANAWFDERFHHRR